MNFLDNRYSIRNNQKTKIPFIQKFIAVLFIISIVVQPPFIFFSIIPNYKLVGGGVLAVLGFFLLLKTKITFIHKKYLFFYSLLQIGFNFFLLVNPDNQAQVISITIRLLMFIFYFILLVNLCKKIDFVGLYVKLIATLTAINVFGYFLLLFNLISPLYEFESQFIHDQDLFYNYGFFVIQQKLLYDFGGFSFSRNCGYFDEPGTFAFYIILALMAHKLFLNKKQQSKSIEAILILGGCTTFSLAFYISILYYIGIRVYESAKSNLSSKQKKIKLSQIVIFTLLVVLVYGVFSNEVFLDFFHERIISRLEITGDEQVFAGNNRYKSFERGLTLFMENIWFGWGPGARAILTSYDPSSVMGALVFYGVIGTPIRYWQFFWIVYKSISQLELRFFIFIIILILNFIQRPHNFYDPFNLLYLFFIMKYFNTKNKNAIRKYHYKTIKL